MGIDFKKYYKLLGDEKIKYKGGALPFQVTYGIEVFRMFEGCKDILDVGCGRGRWSEFLEEKGFNVMSTDINKIYKKAIIDDMHDSKIIDKSFDGVFCNGVFEHSIAPFIMLCEMNRVLKIGGQLFINMPSDTNIEMSSLPQHVNIHSYDSAKNLFDKTKFKIKNDIVFFDPNNGQHLIFLLEKIGDME